MKSPPLLLLKTLSQSVPFPLKTFNYFSHQEKHAFWYIYGLYPPNCLASNLRTWRDLDDLVSLTPVTGFLLVNRNAEHPDNLQHQMQHSVDIQQVNGLAQSRDLAAGAHTSDGSAQAPPSSSNGSFDSSVTPFPLLRSVIFPKCSHEKFTHHPTIEGA